MMASALDREFIDGYRTLISLAEACQRPVNPSLSWHIFDWMAYRLRNKYPAVREEHRIITSRPVT